MLYVGFLLITFPLTVIGDFGVLYARSTSTSNDTGWDNRYCIGYNPEFHKLPSSKRDSKNQRLLDMSTKIACVEADYADVAMEKNMVVVVPYGNCSFFQKAFIAQKLGMSAILIVDDSLFTPDAKQRSDYDSINITIASMKDTDFNAIKSFGKNIEAILFSPKFDNFDPKNVVLFLIAMLCVTVGGYWSGLQSVQIKKSEKKSQNAESVYKDGNNKCDDKKDSFEISLRFIIISVIVICISIVLLYFFFKYLVYVCISFFCIYGAIGLYKCILPLWSFIPWPTRIPSNKLPCFSSRPQLKDLILLAICIGFGVFWTVVRKESYAWLIQDILGATSCIHLLKTLRFPHLKRCFIFLLLMFVYDIFMVFITPLFTKTGESIMEKIVIGGSSKSGERSETGEQLPFAFKVPSLSGSPLLVCSSSYSFIGFGDIIIPGVLISYNHGFDIRVKSNKIYFISTVIAYAVGLIASTAALYLMHSSQPALLYLVPCTLLPTFVIGGCRGEFKLLWNGFPKYGNRCYCRTNGRRRGKLSKLQTLIRK